MNDNDMSVIPVSIPKEPFKAYLFNNSHNRIVLRITVGLVVIQFAVFKYFYPYADFIYEESFDYLSAAYLNSGVSQHLIGYSKFLRLVSIFTSSDMALVALQYLLIQGSACFLLFTLFYFYNPGKIVQMVLLVFMVLNPLFLYIANLVSYDAFFLSLSLTWFSLLLWVLHRSTMLIVAWHTTILFLAFAVHYNSLIYLVVAVLAFSLSRQPVRKKLVSIGTTILMCGLFILYTGGKYKVLTGTWQYAPISGWLIANNAVRTYRYVDSAERKSVPVRFKALDNVIRTYFDSCRRSDSKLPMDLTLFMYPPNLFLNKYIELQFKNDSTSSDLKKWASVAPLYADYGIYIIRQYPLLYVRHFLWPSFNRYYAPPVGSLATYNSGADSVMPVARTWFGYKSDRIGIRIKNMKAGMLNVYPVFSGVINAVMLCCLFCFTLLGGFRRDVLLSRAILLASTIWLINAGVTIFAIWATLRFLSFSIVVTSVITSLMIEWLWKSSLNTEIEGMSVKNRGERPNVSNDTLSEKVIV